MVLLLACTSASDPSREEHLARAAETDVLAAQLAERHKVAPIASAIRVELVFGERADLDLYVTDPSQETVYFANSPSRGGGRLDRDTRCQEGDLGIETVEFEAARPGRYRVGVDFPPSTCAGSSSVVAFVVVFESDGHREERRLSIRPGEFIPIALEVEVR